MQKYIISILIAVLLMFCFWNQKKSVVEVNYNIESLEINELKATIEELKKLKDIKTVIASYEITNASVISRGIFDWSNTLVIDKGSNDGIEEGEVVTNHEALIGTVVEVKPRTSVVRLITDNQNKVSAKVLGKETVYGVIGDYQNNYLTMSGTKSEVEIGSQVVTTGMSYIYPSGIYIGEVDNLDDMFLC